MPEKIDHCYSPAASQDQFCDCMTCKSAENSIHEENAKSGVLTHRRRASIIAPLLESVFLLFSVGLLLMRDRLGLQEVVSDLSISFVAIMVEAMPFMLIGSLIGGLIEEFVPQELLGRLLEGRERSAIFIAAGLGLIFPVCDCAIAPLVKRLLSKGVPLSVAIAFLLAGPIVNPIVAASTWLAYQGDWSFLVTRMVLGYAVAIVVAFLMDFLFRDKKALLIETPSEFEHNCDCCGRDHAPERSDNREKRLFFALQHACDDFFNIGKFLVIGAFIAALARTTIGVNVLQGLSSAPGTAIILMMLLAMALNLCSQTDAFIAAGFRGILPDTAQMAFMILGPMLDIKLLLLYLTMFRKRVIITLALLIFLTVLTSMIFLQYGLGGLLGG
ncbi:MAG: permease [Desulfomonilaceae bacterium]